jgi:hypothetical protein
MSSLTALINSRVSLNKFLSKMKAFMRKPKKLAQLNARRKRKSKLKIPLSKKSV